MVEKQQKLLTSGLRYIHILQRQVISRGGQLDKILSEVGIDEAEMRLNPEAVSPSKLEDLARLLLDRIEDENFGFCKVPCKPGTFCLMARVSIREPTLEQAIQLGIRFYSHSVEDYELGLCVFGDRAHMKLRLKYPELDIHHLLTEAILMNWHRYLSWFIGQNIPIIESYLAYPKPPHWEEYQYILPSASLRFDQSESGFCFAAEYLRRGVVHDISGLDGFLTRDPMDTFLRYQGGDTTTKKVRIMLEKDLGDMPLPSIEGIAKRLNMSSETLRRKLRYEGMSYRRIKDSVRRDAALYHLANRSIPVNEIADLMGYSEPSAFTRAFKEWTGETPQEYRNRNRSREIK